MSKETTDGIQVMQLHELHSAIVTASASLTTGTAATLLTGDSDYFLDLIRITGTTTSNVAAGTAGFTVALTNDGTTVQNMTFAHFDMQSINFDVPMRQITKNTPWIVDMDDVTGTTVNLTAQFVKRNHT